MRSLLLLSLLFALPALALAHTTGVYYQAVSGSYAIDVGYSTPAPTLGEVVLFDFQLRDKDSANSNASDVPFDDVWVKVIDERGAVVLATGIHNFSFGGPRLSYAFPNPGMYRIAVRYETAEGTLAEGEFPLTVVESSRGLETYGPEAAAFVVGVLIGLALMSRKLRSLLRRGKLAA